MGNNTGRDTTSVRLLHVSGLVWIPGWLVAVTTGHEAALGYLGLPATYTALLEEKKRSRRTCKCNKAYPCWTLTSHRQIPHIQTNLEVIGKSGTKQNSNQVRDYATQIE